ncbi:bcl-2-binding component 3 isoform X1 [Lampris incognitus]|uniref:bcl-2-binding component 3 isoform X1 n=1 Tax=Lampris incognitus TaxID=2546036 RepID=UPI0024B6297F|nr:bcl-2-binding component 3 isoform X1 [Lampris incognitus]
MARAETTESVGEPAGAGGASLAHLSTCCMELPHSFHSWPGLLTNANAPGGTIHLPRRHHQHHSRRPVQDLALPCPLPYLLPAGMEDAPQMHRPSSSRTPPSPPPQRWREEARDGCGATPSAYPGERFGGETTDRHEQQREASSRRGPLPDLLPSNGHLSSASEGEVRRIAGQLRLIGDEMNTTILRRAAIPEWQGWIGLYMGMMDFLTQTLNTLYRLI